MRRNLRKARKTAGMTQQQLADKLGVGLRQYQRIEQGTSDGTFYAWDTLEDMFNVHQRVLREIHHDRADSQ